MAAIGRFNTTNLVLSTLAVVTIACFADAAQATGANHYGVTISKQPTQNMSFANGVYSATADGANLNVNDLTNALAAGNVEVTTGNGSGGDKMGDLHVDAGFTWASASGLTLDAYHSIFVTRAVVDAGTGALTLTNNDGGKSGTFVYAPTGSITIWSLTNTLTIDGQAFTLVGDIKTLASDIAANPSGTYALAASYDASKDGTYSVAPVATAFGGTFDALGNTISNLKVDDQTTDQMVGLFAELAGGTLRNITLDAAVSVAYADLCCHEYAGALVGFVDSGTITNIFVTAYVSSGYNYTYTGGVVGYMAGGTISNVVVSGSVTGANTAGGLMGSNNSGVLISDTHANVSVWNSGLLGGLVGGNFASIALSSAEGAVSCGEDFDCLVGGLVGITAEYTSIQQSYASGTVTAPTRIWAHVGGLAGASFGAIQDCYSTGKSSAHGKYVGGLMGWAGRPGTIQNSYAAGRMQYQYQNVGGFIGSDHTHAGISAAYWDTTNGIHDPSRGAGNIPNDPGITGVATTQLQSGLPPGFDPTIWTQDPKINHGFPYLIANPPPQ